jgi:hypothetical protein
MLNYHRFVFALASACFVFGCTVQEVPADDDDNGPAPKTLCATNDECAVDTPEFPVCDFNTGECLPLPAGHPLGWRDGSAESVSIPAIYSPEIPLEATDLAFHTDPARSGELWVARRPIEPSGPCLQSNTSSVTCSGLEGSIGVVFNAGTTEVSAQSYKDFNAWHFMRRPSALAFGDNGNFATVHEARTGNFTDDPLDFIGPSLWTSALPGITPGCETSPTGCFSVQPPGKNGSHLDMLHCTPWGMGIAHEQGNMYWVLNGNIGALERYDFRADHGPGNDDHTDGYMRRYVTGQLTRVPNVPSHLVFNKEDGHVYAADTGAGRIVKLNPATGAEAGGATPNYEAIDAKVVDGAMLTVVVPPGILTSPSGIELHEGHLYVTDNATSRIHAFDLQGQEVRQLQTNFAPGSLAGLTIGPDGKVYFVEKPTGWVHRIDPM